MKKIKLIGPAIFLLIMASFFSCEEKEDLIKVSVTVSVIDSIKTGIPEYPLISSQSEKISEFCTVRIFYQNLDEDPFYNERIDHYIGRDTACNGKDAPDHEFEYEKIFLDSLCNVYIFYIDNEVKFMDTVCSGEQGPAGPQGPKGDSDTIVKIERIIEYDTIIQKYPPISSISEKISEFCTITTFYQNLDEDTLYNEGIDHYIGGDTSCNDDRKLHIEKIKIDELCNVYIYSIGEDTLLQDTLCASIVERVEYDTLIVIKIDSIFVIGRDTTHFYRETILKEGPVKFFPCKPLWCEDPFSETGFIIDRISFIGGNLKGADIEVYGKDFYGDIIKLFEFPWEPVVGFNYLDKSTYIKEFENQIDKNLNISSIGIFVKYSSKLCIRNDYIHIRNIEISGIKEE